MIRGGIGSNVPHGGKRSGYCWILDEGYKMRRFCQYITDPKDLKYSMMVRRQYESRRPPICQTPNRGRSQSGGSNVACTTFEGFLVVPTQKFVCWGVEVDENDRSGPKRTESVCAYRGNLKMAVSKSIIRYGVNSVREKSRSRLRFLP
jgi:hypothetical protein